MNFLNKNFISLSIILSGCLYGETIQTDTTLEPLLSSPSSFKTGGQDKTSIAGLLINSVNTGVNVAINPQNTRVSSFSNSSVNLYGIFSNTSATLHGKTNEKLIFEGISTQSASITGIKTSSLVLDNASIIFQSITSNGKNASNSDIRGIDSHSNQGLNLVFRNNASIVFRSITSQSNLSYIAGIATGLKGASSNIDISQGSLSFDLLKGVETTAGLVFQATNNSLSGDITFSHIESTGDLVFNGKPIARNAYGISFAPSASATLKENSRIYITSMASKGDISPLFAQQALSLTFEKNAGLIYGAISEDEKANNYGIYAKTDKTLNYYFGAGDQAGSVPSGAKGTIFQSIESMGNSNAYGMYLQTTTQAKININGQAVFRSIQAKDGNAYGIYSVGTMSLQGISGGVKKLTFGSIMSQGSEAVGLAIAKDSSLLLDGVEFVFGGVSGKKSQYAIKNEGSLKINQANLLSFGTSQGKGYAIGNGLENLIFESGVIDVGDGISPIALQYGFYDTAQNTKFNGSLSIRNFSSISDTDPFSLIYYDGAQNGVLNIDHLSISAYGDQSGTELLGFNASRDFQINLQNTLKITLANKEPKMSNTSRREGMAFGENVSLKLGENAKVIFNSGGGKLKSLSNFDGENGGVILLAGERDQGFGGTKEYDNRIWKNSDQARMFNARHLDIANLQTNGAQFVLYADKNARLANYSDKNLFGMAYINEATSFTDRTSLGGSDSLSVLRSTQKISGVVSNNLAIALGGLSKENQSIEQNAILAIVDSSVADKVVFNGLAKHGDSVLVKSYSGYDVFDLEIKRFDDAKSGDSFYYSNLVAYNPRIDTQYLTSLPNLFNINFFTLSGNLNSLSKRLGDLKNENNSSGIWARVFGGEQIMNFGVQTSQAYVTAQVGYDYGFGVSDAKNYIGVALSYSYASSIQDEVFYQNTQGVEGYKNSAKTNEFEVAFYDVYQSDGGFYSDSIAKFGYLFSDINLYKDIAISNYSNFAFMLSEEIGYEFGLGTNKEWIITPQGELAYAFMNGQDLSKEELGGGLGMQSQALHLLRMRVGANWGYRLKNVLIPNRAQALFYVGTYYEYDGIFGGDKTFLSDLSKKTYNNLSSNGKFTLNLVVDVQINEDAKLYFDFEKSFGNLMYKNYQVNFGARYSFGEKIHTSQEKQKDTSAPLSIPSDAQEEKGE